MVRLLLLKNWGLIPTVTTEKKAVAEANADRSSEQTKTAKTFLFVSLSIFLHAHHWQKLTEPDGKSEMWFAEFQFLRHKTE